MAARDWAGRPSRAALRYTVLAAWFAGGLLAAPDAMAGDVYAFTGFSGSSIALYGVQGLIYTPLSGLGETGPIARLWMESSYFDYQTSVRLYRDVGMDVTIHALGTGGSVEAGYQIAGDTYRLAGFLGAVYRDYVLTPVDERSDLNGSTVGVKVVAEGHAYPFDGWGAGGYASYITGVDEYWVQIRPGYRWTSGLAIGIDAALWGGEDYRYARAGLFAQGFEVDLLGMGRIFLGGEAGMLTDTDLDKHSPFGGLNLGFFF